MQVPNLPTDSLYKFMAIFGIIIILGSYYLDFVWAKEVILTKSEWGLASKKMNNINKLLDEQNKFVLNNKNIKWSNELIASFFDRKLDMMNYMSEFDSKKDYNYYLAKKYDFEIKDYLVCGRIVGLILMISGFFLWYWKIQRHMDKHIKSGFN